jgi:hypothetical protein
VKSKFLKTVKAGLYKEQTSFLSNPLLCIMMLITFEQYGHIPDKMHVFYEHALDALFFRHDASKEGTFKRKTYSGIPEDDFRNCLSAFCMITYTREKFSFRLAELKEALKQAFKLEKHEVDNDAFIKDLMEGICVLQMEGLDYVFTHRSFQEYFAAHFIARSPSVPIGNFLDQFCKRREDKVVNMAFDMNQNLLEREWIIPKLRDFRKLADITKIDDDPIGYVIAVFGQLSLSLSGPNKLEFIYEELTPNGYVWLVLVDLYSRHFRDCNVWADKQRKRDADVITNALENMMRRNDPRLKRVSKLDARTVRANGLYRIDLNASDNGWIAKTRVPEYERRIQEIFKKMLGELETGAEAQGKMLQQLLG